MAKGKTEKEKDEEKRNNRKKETMNCGNCFVISGKENYF